MDSKEESNEENNKMKYILYYLITASVLSLGGIIYKYNKEKDKNISEEELNKYNTTQQILIKKDGIKPPFLTPVKESQYVDIFGGSNNKKSKKKINKKIKKSKKKY